MLGDYLIIVLVAAVNSVRQATISAYLGTKGLYKFMSPSKDLNCFLVLGTCIDIILASKENSGMILPRLIV